MKYIISAVSDIGTTRKNNQDCIGMKVFESDQEDMVFAVLCDGMGGLAQGEIASAAVVNAFLNWAEKRSRSLCGNELTEKIIFSEWRRLINDCNHAIKLYGLRRGINLGTTLAVIMITNNHYYIVNVGDTRIYEVGSDVKQLTKDHTFIAYEVKMGHMTEEQAKHDKRKNILLQCIGASDEIFPDYCFGNADADAVYVLCSDGLHHELQDDEIRDYFRSEHSKDRESITQQILKLVDLCKSRQESDNITVGVVKTLNGSK